MIRAKKSLGQNFLIDKNIIDKIINTTTITDNEILEVGPGTGNLTKEILKNNPRKMYLIEKDKFLAESLKEIVDYGFSIKHFRNHSDLCLAGEDKSFISKFMTKQGQSIFKPALPSEIFPKEDFIK